MKNKVLLFISFLSMAVFCQQSPEDELGVWFMFDGNHQLSEKWTIKTSTHFRFFDVLDDFQQYTLRLGGNYSVSDLFSFCGGYYYTNKDQTYNIKGGEINEHRVYEDFKLKHQLKALQFSHRFRFEHRFFKDFTRHRFRYLLGLKHPIHKKWIGYAYEEFFFNFTGKSYAENRIGLGVAYKLSDFVNIKAGYLHIAQTNSKFNRLQLGVVIKTNHQKNK